MHRSNADERTELHLCFGVSVDENVRVVRHSACCLRSTNLASLHLLGQPALREHVHCSRARRIPRRVMLEALSHAAHNQLRELLVRQGT